MTKEKMDCCENTKDKIKGMKGGKNMTEAKKTNTALWIIIGILILAALFLTFKASSIGTVAEATASAAKTAASTASSGMVGGC